MFRWSTFKRFSAPRYWPIWLGVSLFWLVNRLPIPIQLALGKGMGALLYLFLRGRRKIAKINLRICFPDISENQINQLLWKHFLALGAGAVEVTMAWWTPNRRLKPIIQIQGEHHLQQAIDKGRGVIVLTAHFTTLEIGGQLLSVYFPDIQFCAMYRPHKNTFMEYIIKVNREICFGKILSRDDARGTLRALRQNKVVWYAPDQNVAAHKGEFVTFFNQPACTNTATPRIAKMSAAPVIPYFCERRPDNTYLLKLLPPLQQFPSDNAVEDMEKIHRIYEDQIRHLPEQFFWVHKRFKTRPAGHALIYPD